MSRADAGGRVLAWARRLEACLRGGEGADARGAAAALFLDGCYWRDLVLLTWNIVTVDGRDNVAEALAATGPAAGIEAGTLTLKDGPHFAPQAEEDSSVSGWLNISTRVARGVVRVQLQQDPGGSDVCAVLFTCATELRGFEEPAGLRRPTHQDEIVKTPPPEVAPTASSPSPYVLIVGGSQSGLMLAARLRRLGVPALVVDRHARPGDGWRGRYSGLRLHDPIWTCELPHMRLPSHYPVYMSKDQFGNWLDVYAQAMDIDFLGCTEVLSASYSADLQEWAVRVQRRGSTWTINPKHMVLATGNQSVPHMLELPGMETFSGEILHSSQFPGCEGNGEKWHGKRCVVVGANTSANDIAQDLCEHGAKVAMIQRSRTCVVKNERIRELAAGGGYSEEALADGKDAPTADLLGAALPYALKVPLLQEFIKGVQEKDSEFYKSLELAGWSQTWGDDDTGPFFMFIRRFCGFYFDVGASQHIIDGDIKLHSGETIAEVRPRSVVLSSGSELQCDTIVCATGYQNMTRWVSDLISPEVAEAVGPCWGLGSDTRGDPGPYEGELRNMWKPTAQPGLWFQGGNIGLCRFYSLPLALQLKACYERLPVSVYRRTTPAAPE